MQGHDPEPVIVAVGDRNWARRARLADVLLLDADELESAARMRDELFGRYPGLSMVVLRLPGDVIAIGRRCGRLLVQRSVTAEAAAKAAYFCG